MAKITLDLNTFKASGVYTIEFDASERIVVTTQTIRLVVGFSRLGPINAPVFLRDVNTSRRIFGKIDPYLEKRGSFFHRALETCLTTGPVFALNLMPLKSTPVSEGGDATNYRSFALAANESNGPVTDALVVSFYNKERFWFPDREYVIATADSKPINRDYLFTVVNLSQSPISVIVRKSVNATQYNVTAQDYYGLGNVPDYMNNTDFLSDFFLDLIIVQGDWTDLGTLRQDPFYSRFFDARGVKADKLAAFLSLDSVTMIGSFTGSIIPDFIDNAGSNQFIENIVNANIGLTGTFIGVNVAKIDDYMNSVRKIDTIGNSLINTTDDTIDFLSYNTPIKSILEFTGEVDLDPATSTDITMYDGAGAGLNTSTSSIYVKSFPFGGRSGKWNNVLVIPKPQPADTVFLPSQYQYIADSLTTNSLVWTNGINSFATEMPNDYLKVENVTDTGTALQIQLSSPLNQSVGYFDTIIATGSAILIPSVANEIDVTVLNDEAGNPITPAAGDFILVEAAGLAKYYQVASYAGSTITVEAAALSDDAPYYFNQYGTLGLDILDYSAYVQPSDIKVTIFVGDVTDETVDANRLVPNLGLVLPSIDFGYSLTFAFAPTVTVESYEGIGSTLATVATPVADAPASVEVIITDLVTNLPIAPPTGTKWWIAAYVLPGGYGPGVRSIDVEFSYGTVTLTAAASADLGTGLNPIKVTLVQSGVSFSGLTNNTGAFLEQCVDILKLRYIESYPGSKLSTSIKSALVVNGDSLKYNTGSSEYNYLGVINNWSKSGTSGSTDDYSQVAYGLRGTKVAQYTATDLVNRVGATFAGVDQTYEDATLFNPGALNDLAFYSSAAKNLSSNVTISGTLFGGGKRFEVTAANVNDLNVGDLLVDNSLNPRLTRVIQKVKKVNPSTGAITYEFTTLDVPYVDTITNTVTKFTPIQTFCDHLQFTLLNGYVLGDYHLPDNTDAQIAKIYGVIEETNIGKTLASRDVISFRYLVDTFNGGIAPQMGPKSILSRLAKNRQKCMALLNAPSIKQFIASTDPRFTEVPDPQGGNPLPLLNTAYIADGGNLSLGPTFRFSLPDEENGAKFIGVFSPNLLIRDGNKNWSVPPAADISNNFVRKFIAGNPYAIVAGPRRGVISNPNLAGLEYEFLLQDREYLEPMGINPIVTVKGVGPMIYANQSAYQKTLSAFNNLHVRDLLITVEEAVEDVLTQYLFEFNDASTRLEIRTIVENYLDTVRNAGGVYDYAVIMDDTNNTSAVIDSNFGILDIGIEPTRGLQKFINRVTILKTGTISSGGFTAA